jgi:cytochrome c oxidase subunit II
MGKGSHGWQHSGSIVPGERHWSSHLSAAVLGVAILLIGLAGPAAAHAAGSASPDEWDRLLLIVLGLGTIVAVIVYSVMVLGLWRYRESSDFPRKEPSTHNTRLETIWTIIPVILVTIVIVLTLDVMSTTEDLPEEGITIEVIAKQFEWKFVYPDNSSTIDEVWVEEGQTVIFEIHSEDVIHSFSLPAFRLKVDAFPNYVDNAYIIAEPAGDYDIYCAEFCGDLHSSMLGTLHIYHEGTNDKPWGPPPGEIPPPPETEEITIDLEMREDGGPDPEQPWSMTPSYLELPYEADVTLRVWNNGTMDHSFRLEDPYDRYIENIPSGEFRYLNFTSDKPTGGINGYCDLDDHRERGLVTLIVVEQVRGGEGIVVEDASDAILPSLYGLAVLIFAVMAFLALRTPKADRHEDHVREGKDGEHDYHLSDEDREKEDDGDTEGDEAS